MTEIIATCISIGIDLIAIFLMLIWLEIKKRLGRIYKNMTDEEYILNRAKWLDKHDKEIYNQALDDVDNIITEQLDKSDNQVECQTLRWVLDVLSDLIK